MNLRIILSLVLAGFLLPVNTRAAEGGELPKPETVLQRVLDNLEQDLANEKVFKANYRYTRSKSRQFKNVEGEIKKSELKVRTNEPAAVVSAPVVAAPKPAPKEDDEPVSETNTKVRGKQFEKSDFPIGPELLQRFEFTVAGRETVNGRPAVLLDFAPAKGKVPERNIKDKFLNKAAGRVWIDEAESVLVKADVYLSKPVSVLGGLVGAVKVFTFNFTRHRTPEGLWFTRNSSWHLEGREVFVRRVVDYHEEIVDVQRVK